MAIRRVRVSLSHTSGGLAIPHPTKYFVQHRFRPAELRSEDPNYTALDAELAAIQVSLLQTNERLRLISTANGTLKYDLVSRQTFTATASQTAFTLSVSYNTTDDRIVAYTNGGSGNLARIPSASITNTSSTVVTLPAQSVGATVEIEVLSPGNGNTALAATTAGNGASLIGIYDSAGLYAATTVEDALAEVMDAFNDYVALVGTLSDYIRIDGTNDFTGAQSMGGFKLTDLAEATAGGDAVRFDQVSSLLSVLGSLSATFLALSGGTMAGEIDMDANKITGLAAATTAGDALRYEQALLLVGGTMTGPIAMGGDKITGLAAATANGDAVRYEDLEALVPDLITFPVDKMTVETSTSTQTFTVPDGVTRVVIEVWGAGGAGALGSGGGAGGYGRQRITVAPGDVLEVHNGDGGSAGLANPADDGEDTWVENTTASIEIIRATGGAGASDTVGTSASGGTSSATFNISGGSGTRSIGATEYGDDAVPVDIGGAGGSCPQGGAGGRGSYGALADLTPASGPQSGRAPGGGGGGGFSTDGSETGAAGANGRTVIWY